MTVRSITVGRTAATWTRDGGELSVTPAAGLRTGSAFTTAVHYDGVPKTVGTRLIGVSGFIHTVDGALVVGEPDVAAIWFPVDDHPSDKATYAVRVTVPAGLRCCPTRFLPARTPRPGGPPGPGPSPSRWPPTSPCWRSGGSTSRRTAATGSGSWTHRRGPTGDRGGHLCPGRVRPRAGDPGLPGRRLRSVPVASAGTVDDLRTLGFALENQTRPTYARGFFTDRVGADSVVVHELSHQWFSDSVAVDAWQHIWLNEGFATYAEWL